MARFKLTGGVITINGTELASNQIISSTWNFDEGDTEEILHYGNTPTPDIESIGDVKATGDVEYYAQASATVLTPGVDVDDFQYDIPNGGFKFLGTIHIKSSSFDASVNEKGYCKFKFSWESTANKYTVMVGS